MKTDTVQPGADTDGDGIPDAWERLRAGNLTTMNATTDSDGDGRSDLDEYRADTNPFNASDYFQSSGFQPPTSGSLCTITWASIASRLYRIQTTTDLATSPWIDSGLGLVGPDAGSTTTRNVPGCGDPERFFRIQVIKPLSP